MSLKEYIESYFKIEFKSNFEAIIFEELISSNAEIYEWEIIPNSVPWENYGIVIVSKVNTASKIRLSYKIKDRLTSECRISETIPQWIDGDSTTLKSFLQSLIKNIDNR